MRACEGAGTGAIRGAFEKCIMATQFIVRPFKKSVKSHTYLAVYEIMSFRHPLQQIHQLFAVNLISSYFFPFIIWSTLIEQVKPT